MSGPNDPYRVLGVAPDASPAEVRAAYLSRARTSHPDRHAGDPAAQRAAEEQMRALNAAWAVLGDPDRRAEHDRRAGHAPPAGPILTRPSRTFTPHAAYGTDPVDLVGADGAADEADDEADDDDFRYQPDPFDERTAIGRVLGAGPPLLFVAGLVLLVVAALTGLRALLAVGVVALLVALVAFIGVPIIAVARSKAHDPG